MQREDVWSIVPQLVLDKIAGFVKFSSETMVVAAGNRPEDCSLVRLIHNSLLNRFKKIDVECPSIEAWSKWMDERYPGAWDKRVLAFLLAFKNDGVFLKVPKEGEGLEPFPSPRTWTWLALDLAEGFGSVDDICGLVGTEVGYKFKSFIETKIDLDSLLDKPEQFRSLSFDSKYMVPIMLGNRISNRKFDFSRAFALFDVMAGESREFAVITLMSVGNRARLTEFLVALFAHNPDYRIAFSDLVETVYAITKSS